MATDVAWRSGLDDDHTTHKRPRLGVGPTHLLRSIGRRILFSPIAGGTPLRRPVPAASPASLSSLSLSFSSSGGGGGAGSFADRSVLLFGAPATPSFLRTTGVPPLYTPLPPPPPAPVQPMQTEQVLKRVEALSVSMQPAADKYANDDAVQVVTPPPALAAKPAPRSTALDAIAAYPQKIRAVLDEIRQKYRELALRDAEAVGRVEERRKAVEVAKDKKRDDNYPELTAEQEAEVKRVLALSGSSTVVDAFNLVLKGDDTAKLRDREWLNDEVINFYLRLIVERAEQDPSLPRVFAFNTFFYLKMSHDGYDAVKRWSKKVDVFAMDHVLIPVHLGMHWCLANVNFARKRFEYYDSLHGRNPQALALMREYVQKEHLAKKGAPFDLTGWTDYVPADAPSQENGYDCGVFTCINAEFVSRNEPLTFAQPRMQYFRRRMVWELLSRRLMVPGRA